MYRNRTLPVMEVYHACQGEGILMGQPSMFIRLFGCNLRCSWCDTAYSINRKEWKASGEEGEPYKRIPIAELVDEVQLAWTNNIIITGGEPTIHGESLVWLVQALTAMHRNVTIETNGTIIPEGLKEWKLGVLDTRPLWSISPKSAHSSASTGGETYLHMNNLQWYTRNVRCQLKFVCQSGRDLHEALEIVRLLPAVRYSVPVIIQPEGTIIKEGVFSYLHWLKLLQALVEENVLWEGYDVRVLPQLHTMIHGQERFV